MGLRKRYGMEYIKVRAARPAESETETIETDKRQIYSGQISALLRYDGHIQRDGSGQMHPKSKIGVEQSETAESGRRTRRELHQRKAPKDILHAGSLSLNI